MWKRRKIWAPIPCKCFSRLCCPVMPGIVSGILMVFMPTISTFAIAELLTMNNIKLFGTTIQENINNSMWNYGAALSLIMLFLLVRQPCSLQMIRIITKEADYGKENFVSGGICGCFCYCFMRLFLSL